MLPMTLANRSARLADTSGEPSLKLRITTISLAALSTKSPAGLSVDETRNKKLRFMCLKAEGFCTTVYKITIGYNHM